MSPAEAGLAFPELVDNTAMSEFGLCETRGYYFSNHRIVPSGANIHLHAGGAFAFGLEKSRRAFYQDGLGKDEAMRLGLEAIIQFYGPITPPPAKTGDKSVDNVVRAFDSYMQRYPLGEDPIKPLITANGQAMVEFTFSMPTEVKHPLTGNPILYGGRADMIGAMTTGEVQTLFVTDEKTASQLGESWAKQFDLDSQFTGYIAAAKTHGYPVAGALVRGVGLLKTKISHAEVTVYRKDWEIQRWWENLHLKLHRWIRAWETGQFEKALAKSACSAYGECPYALLCKSSEPDNWIPLHYRRNTWNPLEKDHGEHLLENEELRKQLESPDLYVPELDI